MNHEARKSAADAFKEQRVTAGTYAIRCLPTSEIWVGAAPNLGAIQTRLWFTLRAGTHAFRDVQAAWNAHGEDAFVFEVLEAFDKEDLANWMLTAQLKERVAHWRAHLNARAI